MRYATFQVMSLLTTTGFTTADYEQWPQAAQMFIVRGVFHRGLRRIHHFGHQGGALRNHMQIHVLGIDKAAVLPAHDRGIHPAERPSHRRSIVDLAICYFIVNIFLVLAGGCFMVLSDDMDYVTAMSSVIATLMNIGPGFGAVGPADNYAFISDVGKWFLSYI
jgi:trk system potassium uptake protein TrkH